MDTFSPDYQAARQRFRLAVDQLNWELESHSISRTGPDGEELTIDVGLSNNNDAGDTLILSSGVHGVEGFFGSAVQIATLQRWAAQAPPGCRCVLLHGLNPYGFAHLRRFDENNVDPNRNFLLPGEQFTGAPAGFKQIEGFLNPQRPPSQWEPLGAGSNRFPIAPG